MSNPSATSNGIVCGQVVRAQKGSREDRINKCCSAEYSGRLGVRNRGLACWTALDDDLVRRLLAEGMVAREISVLMGFHLHTILLRLRRLGISQVAPWSAEEVQLLKDVAPVMRTSQIARLTGRSIGAIKEKIRFLDIKRPASFCVEHGLSYHLLPPDLKEVIGLQKKLKRKLRDEEHRRLAATPLRATRNTQRPGAQA